MINQRGYNRGQLVRVMRFLNVDNDKLQIASLDEGNDSAAPIITRRDVIVYLTYADDWHVVFVKGFIGRIFVGSVIIKAC